MEENKLNTVEQPRDRVVLVGLSSPVLKADSADEESMDELAALVETAGAVSVATVLQNLPSPNPRSFIGEGKVAEIKELIGSTEATMAIFDNDLSPSQMRVLTEDLGVQVLDRSGLTVEAFNQHKDYASRNLTYVRAELRAAQVIWRPANFVVLEAK